MALSLTEIIAGRRLASVYRRLLLLAVPAALAGCQDAGDALAPESADPSGPVATSTTEAPAAEALLAAASLNRIAFASSLDATGQDVWTMSPTGGGMTHLTSIPGDERHPIWSPDHKRIAYQHARVSPMTDVFLMNADGTNGHWALKVPSGYWVTNPSWAPDGKSILMQIWIGTTTSYIGKIDLASGQWMHQAPAGHFALQGRDPIYSKDGSRIYYLTPTGNSLHRFQPNGQDVLVKSFPAVVGDMALSPDGTELAYYLEVAPGNSEIHVLTLATNQTKRLTYDSHRDSHPAWSPDGSLLAFVSDRSGKRQIYTMNSSTGGNLQKITSKTYGADEPSWYR